MRKLCISCIVLGVCFSMRSQAPLYLLSDTADVAQPSITVVQPSLLQHLLKYDENSDAEESATPDNNAISESSTSNRGAGYRVQVFSDNNQRTAKNEARSKEQLLKEAFPEFGTYIVFNSPFWRLKVGDFRTQHEADAAADAIKSRFPAFSREVRVVRDRINTHR